MEQSSGISYRKLAWCNTWYLRDETLKQAFSAIVDYHHNLPLSQYWGGGTLSSSDGQRFPVSVKSRKARPLPKYFGYGKGLAFYTWTSDQLSQYGAKVIVPTKDAAMFWMKFWIMKLNLIFLNILWIQLGIQIEFQVLLTFLG